MKFYLNAIEQINSEGGHNEYSNTEKVADYNTVMSKFYKKLSDVSAAIGKTHTFMYIEILNSTGTKVKSDVVGEYVDDDAVEPEE